MKNEYKHKQSGAIKNMDVSLYDKFFQICMTLTKMYLSVKDSRIFGRCFQCANVNAGILTNHFFEINFLLNIKILFSLV